MRWCFFSCGYRSIQVLNGDTRTTGGAEAQVAHLATALARLGHEVGLIYGDGSQQASQRMVAGVTCIDAAPSWRHPASLPTFWRAMDFLSPDLIYARLPSDFLWVIGLFARCRGKARLVYALASDLHCDPWTAYKYKRWFHAPLFGLGLRTADVIALQHAHQERLVSPGLRTRLIHVPNLVCSVDNLPRAYEATKFDAIWVGQIRPAKGPNHFLDLAFALPDLRFAVVGGFMPGLSGHWRASLEQRLLEINNLDYFGPQNAEDVMALMRQSKVLVNTSPAEGFPNTMLEAWSTGVPVVSLTVDPGGVIGREQIGIVSGTMAQLKGDTYTLARSASLNQRFGNKGLTYVRERHSLKAVCEALTQALPEAQLVPVTAHTF